MKKGNLQFSSVLMTLLSVMLVLSLLGPHIPTVEGADPTVKLSLNRAAYASSVEGSLVADYAVDGNLGTRWSSSWGNNNEWIYIDLGANANIERVVLNWENSYATAYEIQVSDDEYSWQTIHTVTTGDGGIDDLTVTGEGRYVRMLGVTRAMSAYGYSLFEFSVYGTGGIPVVERELGDNLALHATAVASSVEEAWYITPGSVNPGKVTDGDPATRWGSIHQDEEWIYVDLGTQKTIGTVRLNWEAAGGRAYDIQISNDAINWTTVYRELRGNGDMDEIPLYVNARYVKMQGIARLTSWGYSMREFEVYGYQSGDPQPVHSIPALPTTQTVQLGEGSYAMNDIQMPYPKFPDMKTSNIQSPIASNDWWQSLLIKPFGDALVTHPLKLKFSKQGLSMLTPGAGWINQDGSAVTASGAPDLFVNANHINAGAVTTKVSNYSDFAVDVVVSDDATEKLKFTIVKGSPYVYGYVNNHQAAEIYSNHITRLFDRNGNTVTLTDGNSITTDVLGIEITNTEEPVGSPSVTRYYGLFLPAGSKVLKAGNKLKLELGGAGQYFSVATLPSALDLNKFYDHAYAHIVDTSVSYTYDEATSLVHTQFNVTTALRRAGFANTTLLAQYPHQWKITTTPLTTISYPTIRGLMKVSEGNSFATVDRFYGIVPQFTEPVNSEYSRSQLLQYLALLDQDTNSNLMAADAYWQGKKLHPLAMGVLIADEIGASAYKQKFLSRMKTILEDWYTYTEDEPYYFFYYEDEWGTLYYKISEFGANSGITDHHFTYGYYVFASAVLAMYDEEFYNDYKDMIDLLVRDYANPSDEDELFPRFRSFDPYSGHSWAGGYADNNNGNNQEAAGESLFGWVGQYLWAVLTEQEDFRDAAIYGFTTELKAIEQYWFNYDGDNWHDDWEHASVGQVYGSSYFYGTFFSGEAEHIYGIHWLPTAEWMTSYAFDPADAAAVYNGFVADNGGIETDWQHIIWPFQALSNPAAALSKWNASTMQQNEVFNAYWFINSMASLGQRTKDIWAVGGHSATVYKKGSTYRALIWNPTDEPITVSFYNNIGLTGTATVQAKSLVKVDPTILNAPELDNFADTEPESMNLAMLAEITASSVQAPYAASNAIDGNPNTRWGSAIGQDEQWVELDFGAVKSFNRVVLNWEAAYGKSYELETSNDGVTWNSIYATTTGDGDVDDLTVSGTGQYLRLSLSERGTVHGYSLWEIEVWSGDDAPESELLSSNKTVTVSSYEVPFAGENAVDGNNGTRWSSGHGNDNEWITIDLGEVATITEVVLNWEPAYATAYRIQVSDDGITWQDAYIASSRTGGVETLPIEATGRYVKLQGEGRATIYGYSLWEMEVYGYTS